MEDLDLTKLYGKEFHYREVPKELQGSARTQAIKDRIHLDPNDGYIIDKHDQFYRDHKLLLKLFQVNKNVVTLRILAKSG